MDNTDAAFPNPADQAEATPAARDAGLATPAERGQLVSILSDANADVDVALSGVRQAIAEVVDAVAADLYQPYHDVRGVVDEMIGGVSADLTAATQPIAGVIDKAIAAAAVPVDRAVNAFAAVGMGVPPDVASMAQANDADPADWIGKVVPAVAAVLPPVTDAPAPPPTSPPPPPAEAPAGVYPPATNPGDTGQFGYTVIQPGTMDETFPAGIGYPANPVTGECPDGSARYGPGIFQIPGDDPGNRYMGIYCVSQPPDPEEPPPTSPPPPIPENLPPGCYLDETGAVVCDDTSSPPYPPPPTAPPTTCCPPTVVNLVQPPPPPPPPKPIDPPTQVWPVMKFDGGCTNWDVYNPCEVGKNARAGFSGGTGDSLSASGGKGAKSWVEQFLDQAGNTIVAGIPRMLGFKVDKDTSPVFGPMVAWAQGHDTAASIFPKVVQDLTGACVADSPRVAGLAATLAAVGMVEGVLHAPVKYLAQSLVYQYQFLNPQMLPGQPDTDNMFLRGKIDYETWACLTKANGNLPGWHTTAMYAKQSLLTPDQVIQLWRRKLIPDGQRDAMLGELAFQGDGYKSALVQLSEQPIGASDIVSLMKRDAFDEKVVKDYNYDKDFDKKFAGKSEEWFYWQGFSKEQARFLWRGHWIIPSNTQLYEAYHRLRPGRAAVLAAQRANAALPEGHNLGEIQVVPPVVTEDMIKEAMEVNDLAPAWVDAMLAIAYRPITNTDGARAYMLGYYNETQLRETFLDNGYGPDDAGTLTEFYVYETRKRVRASSGILSIRKIARLYKSGALDRGGADRALTDMMPSVKQRQELLDALDQEAVAESIDDQVKGIKSRFMMGELDGPDAMLELQGIGVVAERAANNVGGWIGVRNQRSKQVSAMMLCKWSDRGLIGAAEYRDRLERLGFPRKDAQRIARTCEIDSQAKRAKEARAAARQALADTRSAQADILKKLKEKIATAEQQLQELNAEIEAKGGTP